MCVWCITRHPCYNLTVNMRCKNPCYYDCRHARINKVTFIIYS
uniref:Uncharacterized protein n=1 Tax=Ciona intestinalis TaxID=7719 RepID=H2XR05_CIOIN